MHIEEHEGGYKAEWRETLASTSLDNKITALCFADGAVPQEYSGRVRLQSSNRLLAASHIGLKRFLTKLFTVKNVLVVEQNFSS